MIEVHGSVDAVPEATSPSTESLTPVPPVQRSPLAQPQQAPIAATKSEASAERIAIIGTGLAGYSLAKEIRRNDPDVSIRLFTADDGSFYSKPMLSTGFANDKTAGDLIQKTAEQMAQQYRLDIQVHTKITDININQQTILCDDHSLYQFDKLVLATGAYSNLPPTLQQCPGKVYSINSLDDYRCFRTKTVATHQKHVVIIGAGLIGCEYANDLLQAGFQVDIVDPMPTLLTRLAPNSISTRLANALQSQGARCHFDASVDSVEPTQSGVCVKLAHGESIEADMVLAATGLKPAIELAQNAGIETNRGIITNQYLQTSKPNIYALGDCAEVDGLLMFYIAPLMQQAKALAKTLCGMPSKVHYPAMPIIIKTTIHPVVVCLPANPSLGQWHTVVDREQGVQALLKNDHGEILGFALSGDQVVHQAELLRLCPTMLDSH
ncbi:NAD(P)/FAD-dependent oxidoreductase [Thalassotalea maritima]|uniref:NAD(P)/FAD-dependent oxidoreductase n=1 Tax=Thalassotalea maritima TaxID=3242416 RepID=UPI003528F990